MYMKTRFSRDISKWEEYVRSLRHKFGTSTYFDPLSELVSLRQTGTVQNFLDQFDKLLNGVDLTEDQAVSCLLAGLKLEIVVQVKLLNTRSLMKAFNQAKLIEKSLSLQRTSSVLYHRTTSLILPNPKPNFSQPYIPNSPKHFLAKLFTKPTRMLTSAEMKERKSKGLCYWCEKKYMSGHNCPKGKQLYLYEVDEEEEEEPQ
ncbi:hypothetical protein KY290_011134 [Solanum tuberosum]|uniref:Retrotransposon gag domain-containing protein n=1 Tax=Solanum tuberosum TaxID=4113 RepID=A0ABQ7VZS4_SOLTU|nr:hypothetical protein KY284_011157 [Solanum tuberosum]KAH0773997.1 hypothetical protein KY290_011134 [Solanum tuberosum]